MNIALGVVGPAVVVALTWWHLVTRRPAPAHRRTAQPAPVDEHVGVTETGLVGYVAPLLELDETPAGPMLCHLPARPPEDDELWWAVAYAAGVRNDRRRADRLWPRLAPTIGPDWATLIADAEAELAEWHRLTDAVFSQTEELRLVELAGTSR